MYIDVLIVINSLDRGGAETHLLQTLPELHQKGIDISIFPFNGHGEFIPEIERKGIKVISPWFSQKPQGHIQKLLTLIINSSQLFITLLFKRPNIIHFYLPQSYLIGGILSLIARNPVRIMSRRSLNNYQDKYPNIIRKIEYWLHTKMTAILGNSQKVVEQLIHDENVEKEKTHLIYNGLKLPEGHGINLNLEFGIPDQSLKMVMVANLIPYKGHQNLIEGLSKINTERDWDMLFIGHDSHKIENDLKKLASDHQISDRIHFLGRRSDVPNILKSCDIGILASHEEGFSNAILESMGSGLPMIVTNVGGNAEAVIHNECGLVVEAKAPDQIAKAIQTLIDNEEMRIKFGRASKERYKSNFQLETCVQAYYDFYQNLLKKKVKS